jgi:uncharacterized protein (DUF305 family)
MASLMTGWMTLIMACISRNTTQIAAGAFVVVMSIVFIRTQVGLTKDQYYLGMIPHHSMAVHLSRRAISNKNLTESDIKFMKKVMDDQNDEIDFMKSRLSN